MTKHALDNIVWRSLTGTHAVFSSGTNVIRRYAPGFSPIVGFADMEHPGFDALTRYCEPGELFYCSGWSGPLPSGWRLYDDSQAEQLVWDAPTPAIDDGFAAIRLGSEHVSQMLELAAATQPGPFAERTIELGEYYGVLEEGRLVAMAGERMHAGALKEISGVCTHPEFQGRGLARRLVERLVRLEVHRNQTPFMHVMKGNTNARRIYGRMGFRHYQEVVVRVISRAH